MPLIRGALGRAPFVVALMLGGGSFVLPSVARAGGPSVQQCIAANESAQDLQAAGKLREARARLASCESTSCPRPLREDCARRVDVIDRAMPTVVFLAKDAAGSDVSAVHVTIDGAPLADRLDGRALAVDLGEHLFRFETTQGPVAMKKLVIHEGEKDRREVVLLGGAGPTAPESPDKPAVDDGKRAMAAGGAGRAGTATTQRIVGLAVAGAGVAGLVVGGIMGLVAKSTYDGALTHCPSGPGGPEGCGTTGHDASQTAHGQALVSTVAFIAGAVLAAGGATLFFTAPRRDRRDSGDGEAHGASSGASGARRLVHDLHASLFLPRSGAGVGVEGAW